MWQGNYSVYTGAVVQGILSVSNHVKFRTNFQGMPIITRMEGIP